MQSLAYRSVPSLSWKELTRYRFLLLAVFSNTVSYYGVADSQPLENDFLSWDTPVTRGLGFYVVLNGFQFVCIGESESVM